MTLDTARDESSPATPSPDAPSRPAHPASVLSRRLAAVLPVTVVLLVVGQTLTPHGLDKPITTTAAALRELPIAAALRELPIAAAHAGRLYLANLLVVFGLGALAVSFCVIAWLVRGSGSPPPDR
jgi:hypothetical protein